MGPQGGFHVWGSALVRYISRQHVKLKFTLTRDSDQAMIESIGYTVDFTAVDPTSIPDASCPGVAAATVEAGWNEQLGNRVFVNDPTQIDGQAMHLRMEAIDANGRTCSDERAFVAHR
jgi:hypothetical protein